jgi:hypothetical protein
MLKLQAHLSANQQDPVHKYMSVPPQNDLQHLLTSLKPCHGSIIAKPAFLYQRGDGYYPRRSSGYGFFC